MESNCSRPAPDNTVGVSPIAGSTLIACEEPERRRYERWSMEDRERIVAESFTSGKSITQVAKSNGVSLGLLHYWRRHARGVGQIEELQFVPVQMEAEQASQSGGLEVVIRDVTIRVHGKVDAAQLRAVLEAVRE